ncbi:LPS export ABC transporter periplasmic protein LptC [Phenylobacterium sp.]|uniref:LPS export ABC transporter periplasmic protein LptC n=1 Tax=Phenylobacterium sp. TaxID=1871053 RepID=UPI0027199A66|nr:LPS export ABC transporter periplasmic protein LptC [Phenylobacterium sp.]MDO8379800.1 LPS export ABC transporter periplasmic protein LptC [Phenylobacterium sp.]
MTAAFAEGTYPQLSADFERWRKRSRLIRRLRVILPAIIGLILLSMAGFVIQTTIAGSKDKPQDADAPIQLVNPRFLGRDDKGRAFVLTAKVAVRDPKDYQRVMLDTPMLILDEEGPRPTRISAKAGVYREDKRVLNLEGGVKLNGGDVNFSTATSIFNTATGELEGAGEIRGAGALGEIIAKSYGVYDKGERMVFKGGVHTRVESH